MYILCIYEMSVLFCAKQSFVSCDATIIHIFNILPLVCSCYFGWIIVHHIFLYYTPNLMLSLGFVKVILGMLKLTWESSLSKAGAIPPPLPLPWSLPYSETYSFSLFFFSLSFFLLFPDTVAEQQELWVRMTLKYVCLTNIFRCTFSSPGSCCRKNYFDFCHWNFFFSFVNFFFFFFFSSI